MTAPADLRSPRPAPYMSLIAEAVEHLRHLSDSSLSTYRRDEKDSPTCKQRATIAGDMPKKRDVGPTSLSEGLRFLGPN